MSAADWFKQAACRGHPLGQAAWFPPVDERQLCVTTAMHEPARAVCDRCPVRDDCLEWALTRNEQHGMWGGLTPTERRRLTGKTARSVSRARASVGA